MNKRHFKFIVPLSALFIFLLLLEVGLSFFYKKNTKYYIQRPNLSLTYSFDTITLKGVSKKPTVSNNSLGARSNEIHKGHSYKILAFGGSTTESIILDQPKIWTQLVEDKLNQNSKKDTFWVGNFGISGRNSNHHILQTKKMLKKPMLSDSRLALYLVGFNDVIKAILDSKKYVDYDKRLLTSSFTIVPDKELPYFKRSAIWKFLKETKFKIQSKKFDTDDFPQAYKKRLKERANAPKGNKMPNLESALRHYESNIDSLITICKKNKKEVLFITQPVLWRPNISQESEAILNTSFGEKENLDTKTLYKCMTLFNNSLLKVCRERGVNCIDLFPISKESWFYDDCHYTKEGSLEISEIIANFIQSKILE